MKKLIAIALLMASALFADANDKDGIRFAEGTWNEITAKAKQEKKLIFIDCYTSWCGPCKKLSEEVFPLKNVGEVFNKDFINYKADMEKGEGIDLQKKFHVGAYPTLLWVDYKGNIVHRIVGFVKAEILLAEAQLAMNGGNDQSDLEKRYKKNRDNPEAVKAYLNSLIKTSDSRSGEVARHYLSIIPKEQYQATEGFDLIAAYVQSPFDPAMNYIVEHRARFDEKFSRQRVDVAFENMYSRYANALVRDVKAGKEFDEAALQKLSAFMQEQKNPSKQQLVEDTRIKVLLHRKDWRRYAVKIDSLIESGVYGQISSRIYAQWYEPVAERDCMDVQVLERALKWIDKSFKDSKIFSMDYFEQMWVAKVKILERMDQKQLELSKARFEYGLLQELKEKQIKYNRQQAERTKALQDLINRKAGS